jgi:hypothetical protein
MANKTVRERENLPDIEDLPDEWFGKQEFKSEPFIVYLLKKFPPLEDDFMQLVVSYMRPNNDKSS